ncbi:hypothetical protein LWI28_017237 [Acer negundo]|uniref:WEB family protein n=1 Tax=Acer negundo TaxID=4023 RepID=A0AAD5JEM6_ACENE|nr:hypothetical protein LWI28_017237 [Acer negundo]KAK4857370.1 hypothetical protein QYF36_027281 [Acer negundo]
MDTQNLALIPTDPKKPAINDYSSNVDTSRPFRSVKEAVAVFGKQLLVGEIYSPKPFSYSPPRNKQEIITSWKYYSPSQSPQLNPREDHVDQSEFSESLKKLEAELEETKMELKLLKKRESETEIALATLNAEFHKNMSKLAEAEAAAAKSVRMNASAEREIREERMREMMMTRMESSPTLAQILSIGENDFEGEKERKMTMAKKKKKPIVPLVTDLFFFKKKGSSNTLENPLYASPN